MGLSRVRQNHINLVVYLVALVAAVYLRLWQLPGQLIADDEWHAINKLLSAQSYGEIFTSFGLADHCIPLTLFYAWLGEQGWLTEWTLRLPLLIAGLALVILLPYILRARLQGIEYGLFTALLALSPLLIYFSRTARPYALSTLLASLAILAFYRWWTGRKPAWAILYAVLASLTVWLQLVTLVWVLAPFVFFGIHAAIAGWQSRCLTPVWRLFLPGLVTLVGLLLLVLPPLINDYQSVAAKSGIDFMSWETVVDILRLYAGTPWGGLVIVWGVLALIGARVLFLRDPLLAGLLGASMLLSLLAVASSGGAWLHHPLVPARYLLPMLPWLLLCVTLGLAACLEYLPSRLKTGAALLWLGGGYLLGPLPVQYQGLNQFTGHMGYQFDYNWQRNVYNEKWRGLPDSPFFEQLARAPEGSRTLIMVPWLLEWHYSPWYLQQRIHQQTVIGGFFDGVCGQGLFGEYAQTESRIQLKNMIHLSAGRVELAARADYLIYSRWQSDAWRFDAFAACPLALRELLGEPVYADELIEVFDLRAGAADEG